MLVILSLLLPTIVATNMYQLPSISSPNNDINNTIYIKCPDIDLDYTPILPNEGIYITHQNICEESTSSNILYIDNDDLTILSSTIVEGYTLQNSSFVKFDDFSIYLTQYTMEELLNQMPCN